MIKITEVSNVYVRGVNDDPGQALPYYSGRLIVVKAQPSHWPLLRELEDIAEQSAFVERDQLHYAVLLEQTFPGTGRPDRMHKVATHCRKLGLDYSLADMAFREDLSVLQEVLPKFRIELADGWTISENWP
jgi:hypothetical protein